MIGGRCGKEGGGVGVRKIWAERGGGGVKGIYLRCESVNRREAIY